MQTETTQILSPKPRLKFIDMARSIAILMMLEGHFTGAALSDAYRDYQYPLYKIWHVIHGLTTPLFFTVTGLIFVYLLIGKKQVSFSENPRVKKGFKRVGQLLFWGYFIQLNLWSIYNFLVKGHKLHLDWTYAFHVLQSIALGILFVILVYWLYSKVKKGNIALYYLGAGLVMFVFYGLLKQFMHIDQKSVVESVNGTRHYWPEGAPKFIQNMFYGQYSDFSFVRMSGYTILGAMLGAIIRYNENYVRELWFCVAIIVGGICISVFAQNFMNTLDFVIESVGITSESTMHFAKVPISRFGQVVVLIGVLMLIDKYINVKAPLFLKLGQNTFAIYVVHVIFLYGGIFGFGLKPMAFDQNLNPYQAVAISLSAIAFFVLMVKYIEPLEKIYDRVMVFLKLRKNSAN